MTQQSFPQGSPPYTSQPFQSLPPQPRSANPAAIISLITGILMCVPGMGLIALITGAIGLAKTKDPSVGGKGLAIAGLILGILGCLVTFGEVGVFVAGRRAIHAAVNGPAHAIAKQFVADVAAGDPAKVQADCDSAVRAEKLDALVAEAKDWGALNDSTLFVLPAIQQQNGTSAEQVTVTGVADFAHAKRQVRIIVSNPEKDPKVSDFTFTDLKKQ